MIAATPPRKGPHRDAVTIKVDNLVPGVAYQFRVCAQNEVGWGINWFILRWSDVGMVEYTLLVRVMQIIIGANVKYIYII